MPRPTNQTTAKRRLPVWAVVVITVAAIAVAGVVSLGVVDAVSKPSAKTAATPSATTAPTGVPTIAPISDSIGQKVNGCLAGADITGGDLLQIRRQKDLTAQGAAEFLGAFVQVTDAADPGWRDDIKQVAEVATSGTMQTDLNRLLAEGSPNYGDANKHTADLSHAAFQITALHAHTITIQIATAITRDGTLMTDDNGQYQYSGGTFTLTATSGGWVVSDLSTKTGWLNVTQTGTKFTGGC